MEIAALAVEAVLNSTLRCSLNKNSDPKHFPYLLVVLTDGRALTIAESCKHGEGLELW